MPGPGGPGTLRLSASPRRRAPLILVGQLRLDRDPAARDRGSGSPLSSPFNTGPSKSPARPTAPAPLPAPPAAPRPPRAHPYAGHRPPTPGSEARPTPAATALTTCDGPAERRGPPAHTLRPAPGAAGWRFQDACGGARPSLPVAYWSTALSLKARFLLPLLSSISC